MRMSDRLEKHVPPGIPVKRELAFFLSGLGAAFAFSLFFFPTRYAAARQKLYTRIGDKAVLLEDRQITDFAELFEHSLTGFLILGLCLLFVVVYHYAYYRMGSMSIYLMKRLPRPWERHKRAWTLPLWGLLICLLAALLTLALYFAIYMLATPKPCLASDGWQQLWGILS